MGRSEAGPYLVLELLEGETLADRLGRGPLPVYDAVRIACDIARALVHAHGRGVLHRDLKPTNVFLATDGTAKVLDFGLAHVFGRAGIAGSGTPGYMAPEQLAGADEDERTDVFALGMCLAEMLAPPRNDPPLAAPPTAVPRRRVPPQLAAIVSQAMSSDKARRPDPSALLAALTALDQKLRTRRARRWRNAIIATLASLLAVYAGTVWHLSNAFVSFPVKSAEEVLALTGIRGWADVGLPSPEDVAFVADGATLRG